MSTTVHKLKFKIEERRRQVASMLAQSMTQEEIASKLNVDQTTVSGDIAALKKMSQRFVYDLAKSDLAFFYLQCLNGVDAAKAEAWKILQQKDNLTNKDRLAAIKIVNECEMNRFSIFKDGPLVISLRQFEDKLKEFVSKTNE
jgi:DNA-directed RNA polymerase specialized sigma subunit